MRLEPMPRNPQPCDRISALLPGFVSEELADEQLGQVHAHLRDCVGCRREAADYMQANKALHRAAVAATVEHDVPFEDMHADIMRRVTADNVIAVADSDWPDSGWPDSEPESRLADTQWGSRLMMVAAAVLLASFGFWLGADPEPQSIWSRPGTSHSGSMALVDEGIVVVPYAGSPADIRPVGLESAGGAESGIGTGMAGRGVNRMPVELLPAVHYGPK